MKTNKKIIGGVFHENSSFFDEQGFKQHAGCEIRRCNYFVIYDTEEGLVKTIENKGQMSGGGQELQQPSKSLMKMWMSLSLEYGTQCL